MLSFLISNAYAMGAPAQGGSAPEVPWYFQPFTMMAILIGVFYFFILRPQQQERKQLAEKLSSIKVGDKIVTSGGIYGIVSNASGDPIKIKIADNVKIDVSRSAIVTILAETTVVDTESKGK